MYTVLDEAITSNGITLDRMLSIHQVYGGAVVRRGWMNWKQALERFTATPLGLMVHASFGSIDVSRKNTAAPLSMYIRMPKSKTQVTNERRTRTRQHRKQLALARTAVAR
jgi:hypothetical protein